MGAQLAAFPLKLIDNMFVEFRATAGQARVQLLRLLPRAVDDDDVDDVSGEPDAGAASSDGNSTTDGVRGSSAPARISASAICPLRPAITRRAPRDRPRGLSSPCRRPVKPPCGACTRISVAPRVPDQAAYSCRRRSARAAASSACGNDKVRRAPAGKRRGGDATAALEFKESKFLSTGLQFR